MSNNFTQDFLTSRRNYNDGTSRVNQVGRLWYDSETNTIRVGDGTPGGLIVSASGGGGGSIAIENEGVVITNTATSLNFVGNGVTASHTGGGDVVVNITVPSIGFDGGSPSSVYSGGPVFDAGGVV